jgi:diadenosine tetraphosphate (Ap4A) HIT family hydrolase
VSEDRASDGPGDWSLANSNATQVADCPLCREDGGELILRTPLLRIVRVNDPDYPGFCRVILNAHVRELTDLDAATLARVIAAVCAVEEAQRAVLAPEKINLASFGNQVPHLHWHVIPRDRDDAHFPQPIWGERQRATGRERIAARIGLLPRLAAEICSRIGPQ